jgi:hypothetical protein
MVKEGPSVKTGGNESLDFWDISWLFFDPEDEGDMFLRNVC